MDPTNKQKIRIGKLPPKYTFILNPYADHRFTRCPNCEQKMRQRKLPLFIHVDPKNPVALNKTCRYCPNCDLLITHQDDIETLLAQLFARLDPSLIGNEYLVLGTLERQAWRESVKEPKSIPELLEQLHPFEDMWTVRVQAGSWYPADTDPSKLPVQEPGPLDTPWKTPKLSAEKQTQPPAKSSQRTEIKLRRRRRRRK